MNPKNAINHIQHTENLQDKWPDFFKNNNIIGEKAVGGLTVTVWNLRDLSVNNLWTYLDVDSEKPIIKRYTYINQNI
jgi:hypothetical protein